MPMPVPGVWQQNCDVGHDSVVEVGGHGIVSLTIMPESVTPPPVPLVLVPVVAPVVPVVPVAPVAVPVVVPLLPVAVPELPVLPVVPEVPLVEEPPQATPTATATTVVRRIARTGFKTRYLRRT